MKTVVLILIGVVCSFGQQINGGGGSGGGGGGTVTGVTATAPIVSSGGTAPVISGTYEGNGSKIQLFTGTDPVTNSCGSFDANHNLTGPANCTVDASGNVGVNSLSVTGAGVTQITLGGSPQFGINPQAATYQVLAADFVACKTITVASGTFTITLVASGAQPANGQCLTVDNYGTGTVTIARSGQNINGGTASLILPPGTALTPTGAYVTSNGTNYFAQLFGKSPPQVTWLTSGTAATYTTPLGAVSVQVECVGGGGGGGASGSTPGAAAAGGSTTFSTLTAGGASAAGNSGGAGGSASGGDVNIPGASGSGLQSNTFQPGLPGGASYFGGAGGGGPGNPTAGGAASANSGSGGGQAGVGGTTGTAGSGGAGGYVRKLFSPPSTTYTYTIGAGGSGGTLGTGGAAGGAGAAGNCLVTAYF